jgi:hypothetical protein
MMRRKFQLVATAATASTLTDTKRLAIWRPGESCPGKTTVHGTFFPRLVSYEIFSALTFVRTFCYMLNLRTERPGTVVSTLISYLQCHRFHSMPGTMTDVLWFSSVPPENF